MLERLTPVRRNIALVVLGLLILWFFWTIRSVLNPLILGYLLAFVVHPMVLKLQRRGWKRRTAVNVIFVGAGVSLLLAGTVVFFQGRSLARRVSDPQLHDQMWSNLERELEQHRGQVEWLLEFLPDEEALEEDAEKSGDAEPSGAGLEGDPPQTADGEVDAGGGPQDLEEVSDDPAVLAADDEEPTAIQEVRLALTELWEEFTSGERGEKTRRTGLRVAGGVLGLAQRIFGSVMAVGTLIVLLPIYTYFLLFELGRIHAFVRHYLPAGERTRLARIGTQIGEVLANFFRGRLLVSLLKGLIYTVGLWVAGIDYAMLIGLGAGFLSLIPFVGSMLGLVLATLVGFLEHSFLGSLIRAGVVFGVGELVENYVLVPKILGDSLSLHPIVVLASVMAGGAAFGMFGLLVALPVTASLVILGREFLLPAMEQVARGDPPEAESPA